MKALAALLLLPVLAVPAAHADTWCWQASDPFGDATGWVGGQQNPQNDSDMDLKAAGIATTNGGTLVVWIKQWVLDPVDYQAPTGRRWHITFTVRGVTKTLDVAIDDNRGVTTTSGAHYHLLYDTGVYEIHTWIPLKTIGLGDLKVASRRPPRPADTFTNLTVTTQRWQGTAQSGSVVGDPVVDTMTASFAYPHRAPSCVKPT